MTSSYARSEQDNSMAGGPSQVGKSVSVFLYLHHLKLIWNPKSSSYCEKWNNITFSLMVGLNH